jgi:hypothetical protein
MNAPMNDADMNEISTVDGEDDGLGTPRVAGRVALMAGLGLLALACAAALLTETPSPATAPDCASIDDADRRLRCYDTAVHRSASPPARGAIAPKMD